MITSISLNPCLGGIWSWRVVAGAFASKQLVLILVWVEYGLGAQKQMTLRSKVRSS